VAEDKGRSEDEKLRSLDDDADLLGDEPRQDILFQLQMGAANLFLGYWKVLLYIAGGVLLIAAAYGAWDSNNTSTQQSGHEGIARAERALDDIQPEMTDEEANAIFAQVAAEIEKTAESTTGPARAFAYVRAAQFWMQVEDDPAARKAWSKAAAVGAPGAIGWTAAMGAARAAAGAEDYATALQFLGAATKYEGIMGEDALFTRLQVEVLKGDAAAAKVSAQELETRFPQSGRLAEARALAGGSAG
jgi:hypothetical protein